MFVGHANRKRFYQAVKVQPEYWVSIKAEIKIDSNLMKRNDFIWDLHYPRTKDS